MSNRPMHIQLNPKLNFGFECLNIQYSRILKKYDFFFREEMLSVINEDRAAISTANVGCSPIIFDNPKMRSYPNSSSPRRTRIKKSIPNFSDSEDSRDVQEERRQEFERFRQMRKQKRNSTTQNQPVPPPQFAIGQPISSANISSLFPKVEDPSSGK